MDQERPPATRPRHATNPIAINVSELLAQSVPKRDTRREVIAGARVV
jgi:hypothetical protein